MSRDWTEIVFKQDLEFFIEELLNEYEIKGFEKVPQINLMLYGMQLITRRIHQWLENAELTVKKDSLEVWDKTSGTDRPW